MIVVAAALSAGLVLLVGQGQDGPTQVAFLQEALGAGDASSSLAREAAPNVRVVVEERSFRFERAGGAVALEPQSGGDGRWIRHSGGATRTTPYGSETVLLRGEDGLEHFVTVERRQGERTWSWRLDAGTLEPRSRVDG
ncbi:MAG TPA: hypothetical protein VNT23_10480, partial [Gaiellaceae bacterium]|nr:hypothetical protein [Gaiellaceae bacterium]